MGCGQKAAAMEAEERAEEEYRQLLSKITIPQWETLIDHLQALLRDLNGGSIMAVAHSTEKVEKQLNWMLRRGR